MGAEPTEDDDLITPKEAARLLGGVSEGMLSTWRYRRQHLPFIKVGRKVFYSKAEVLKYRKRNQIDDR